LTRYATVNNVLAIPPAVNKYVGQPAAIFVVKFAYTLTPFAVTAVWNVNCSFVAFARRYAATDNVAKAKTMNRGFFFITAF